MRQLDLLERVPAARSSDPVTSFAAAEEHTRSGRRRAQALEVLERVRRRPGCTSLELADEQLDRYVLARRLPELEAEDLVRRGPARECARSGRQAITWWPAESSR